MSSQSASCNACDLPSFQTFVNAHTRFFDSATGTMEILPTVVQSECFTRTYEYLSSGKLRKTFGSGIWWGLKIPCAALSGRRNFPVLQSSILATPPRYTSPSTRKLWSKAMCSPGLVGYPFWAGSDGGASRRAVSLSLSCQDRKEFLPIAIRKISLRPYARGRLGLRKVENGGAIPEPILGGL